MTRGSSKSCAMSSVSTSRRPAHGRDPVGRREEPDPSPRSHPAGLADEAGSGRDNDPRLQASWHDHAVRRPQHPRRHSHRTQHATPPVIRSSSASSTPSTPRYRHQRRSTPSSTTTPPTTIQKCASGWHAIAAGPSTSRQPRHRDSTPSRVSSPNTRAEDSSVASSHPSQILKPPSTSSSNKQTTIKNHSPGPQTKTKSSPLSGAGTKC